MEEMARQRKQEITKRKFSYFVDSKEAEQKENNKNLQDKTKYLFDESNIKKNQNSKNSEKNLKSGENKKKLIKKNISKNVKKNSEERKGNDLITALKSPTSIVELKEQKINEKHEMFYFKENNLQLGIKQKKKLREFIKIIKEKPIKIIIKTSISKKEDDFEKYQKILKTRTLHVRSFLINQGISHNRISIQIKEKNVSKNWKNEVVLSFIGS